MRVRVIKTTDKLVSDLTSIPVGFARRAPEVVKEHVTAGNKLAQQFARDRSGPHGKNFWKRYSGEMTGPLEGEFGPHDGGIPVGGGWRNSVNLDLPNAADIIGPQFAGAVGDLAGDLFDHAGF